MRYKSAVSISSALRTSTMAFHQTTAGAGHEPVQPDETAVRIRPRAIVLGCALIPFIGRWIFEGEMVRYTFATWAAPFYNAIFVLFLLTLANMGLRRLLREAPLNHLELLCVYAMVSVASALLSTDLIGILITLMGFPAHFATPSNEWARLFHGVLPEWLMVSDRASLTAFYEGNSTLYMWAHIRPWLLPASCWAVFIAAMFVSFLSLSALLRRQWVESERLTFPIIQLPLAMTGPSHDFFGNRLMWIGFAIAGGLTFMNGLHYLLPAVPEVAIRRHNLPLFDTPPWNAVPQVKISFYFFAIALGFLMPVDLSVSCWGFFFLFLLEQIGATALGFDPGASLHTEDQAFGAYMAIGVAVLWGARKHLSSALRTALRRDGGDAAEPVSYRAAFSGLALSLLVMAGFLYAAGASLPVSLAFVVILMALALVISRIRAELGFPVHDLHEMGPHAVLPRLVGTAHLPKQSLGVLAAFYWSDRVFRSHPMPHQMEAAEMASGSREAGRDMLKAVLIAGLIAIPVCFWIYLDGFYRMGAATAKVGPWGLGYGQEIFPRLEGWLRSPEEPQAGRWVAMAIGAGISGGLGVLRTHVIGFPLHPLGYAVANSWGIWQLWLPILIGSAFKVACLKGGGLATYRRATTFFLGLMLGEFVVGCSWTLAGLAFGIRTYDFWP